MTLKDKELAEVKCVRCGVEFAFGKDYYESRVAERAPFFCPNGHKQVFVAPKEV